MYSPVLIAKYFIKKGNESGIQISPMKLQKLLYFAHGWYLALHNKPLIDESFKAWTYGPVLPSIYHRYKTFRNSAVTEESFKELESLDNDDKNFLKFIWKLYKGYSAIELSNLTHVKKSPWDKTYKKAKSFGNSFSDEIDDVMIKNYFQKTYDTATLIQ